MPTAAQHPELAAAVRRASFGFDTFAAFSSSVFDCRNGRVLYESAESFNLACAPLRYPGRDTAVLLPQSPTWSACPHAMLLPDGGDGDASCYRVDVDHVGWRVSAKVSALRSGAWTVHCSAWAELARTPDRIPMITLLAGGKLYMVAAAGFIIAVDLAAASLFAVELPKGVAYDYYGNLVPCRGDDSVLYLFHVKGDQLSVWLRRMEDHGGAGEWVLRDAISVRETCGHLVEQGVDHVDVVGVEDNAEFVFLELNGSGPIVYMHLGSRRVEKVYQRE